MEHFVYVYLDPTKPGKYEYQKYKFDMQPLYVGVSKNYQRAFDHIRDARNVMKGLKPNRNKWKLFKLASLIKKGVQPIINIYEKELSCTSAYALEIDMINKIGTLRYNTGPLYNYVPGGQIVSGTDISRSLLAHENLNSDKMKIVLQMTSDGTVINEWKSVAAAKRDTEISHIDACCRGERLTAGGFRWTYKCDKPNKNAPYRKRKTNNIKNKRPIIQYDMDMNLIGEFSSISQAAVATGINRRSISNMLGSYSRSAGNYIWKYKTTI